MDIQEQRRAALATQGTEGPEASWVAVPPRLISLYVLLHLSRLVSRLRTLVQDPRASLALSEREREGEVPQWVARVLLKSLPVTSPGYSRQRRLI